MSYATKKQLETLRPTVTGIGWATTKQAAVYLNVPHKRMCMEILPELKSAVIGRSRRVAYAELDRWMDEQATNSCIEDQIVNKFLEALS